MKRDDGEDRVASGMRGSPSDLDLLVIESGAENAATGWDLGGAPI